MIARLTVLRVIALCVVLLCVLFAGVALWANHEATAPSYTRFPLPNGSQQALLACAAGYTRLEIISDYPLGPIQEEADQAAGVDDKFEPLAALAGQGLSTVGTQRHFASFCISHHLWP